MNITTIGIDLAKNVVQVHCVDEYGKRVLNKKLKREQVVPSFSNRPACLIGMEACGSAHHWAKEGANKWGNCFNMMLWQIFDMPKIPKSTISHQ